MTPSYSNNYFLKQKIRDKLRVTLNALSTRTYLFHFACLTNNLHKQVRIVLTYHFRMENLVDDLLLSILKWFQKTEESFFLSLVCKRWKKLIAIDDRITKLQILNHYASVGSIAALKLLQ